MVVLFFLVYKFMIFLTDDGDDTHSAAGTDFNEPWNSNVWENVDYLARCVDGKMDDSLRVSEIGFFSINFLYKYNYIFQKMKIWS